jgi:hypothetical protein
MRFRVCLTAIFAAALTSSCEGGGGGPPGGGGGNGNSTPAFSSSSSAQVNENTTTAVYRATATDADGDAIVFSITGGADAPRFTINGASGDVSFVSAPDFEGPTDANLNNVYELTIAASDGTGQTTLSVSITVRDVTESIQVRRRGVGFSEPLFATGAGDGSGRLFIVQKGGLIRVLDPDTGAIDPTAFLDASGCIVTNGEQGLLGLAFAPDFATSGVFYVYLSGPTFDSEIRRFIDGGANPPCGDLILSFDQPPAANHKAGWIGFGPDDLLYIASGDGGGNTSATNPAQDTSSLLGKILRIDISGDDFPADANRDYAIPAGNPFAGGGGAPEVFAYGLRNPFRASFDSVTGTLYIGDVGEQTREEVDIIPLGSGGRNFGWVRFEGTDVFNASEIAPNALPPVLQYLHGNGPSEGHSITGGVVNRGPVEALENDYIFGYFITGHIWSVPIENLAQGTTLNAGQFAIQTDNFLPNAGNIDNVSSFGTDDDGDVYIVDFDGEIFRLEEP